MKRALVTLCALAVLGLLIWFLQREGENTAPLQQGSADIDAAKAPRLEGAREILAEELQPPAPIAEPQGGGKRWILQCRVRVIWGGGFIQWEDPEPKKNARVRSPPDTLFAGRGVRVELERRGKREVLARGKLDSMGDATFEVPALGRLTPLERRATRVHVVSDDGSWHPGPPLQHPFKPSDINLTPFAPPARPEGDDVRMRVLVSARPVEVVTGRVVRENGEPARHAHVAPYGRDGALALETCTDADGRFGLMIITGGLFNLGVRAVDGAAYWEEGLRFAEATARDLGELRLGGEFEFAGRISYPSGAPVAGVPVYGGHHYTNMHVNRMAPKLSCETGNNGIATKTDAQGRFRLHPSSVGGNNSWHVNVRFEGNARCEDTAPESATFPTTSRYDIDSVMHGHRVRFRLVDANNQPVTDARIDLIPPPDSKHPTSGRLVESLSFDVDEQGRADAWLVRGSRWTAHVVAEGGVPMKEALHVPEKPDESARTFVVVPMALSAGVRVYLTGLGKPVFPVVLEVKTEAGSEVWSRRVEDPGYFVALAPGRYLLMVRSIERAPWAPGRSRWLPFRSTITVPDNPILAVDGKVSMAAHLEVTARRTPDADPRLAPHHVKARLEHAETGRACDTFLMGRFWKGKLKSLLYEDLEPGTWTVTIHAGGHRSVTRRVDLVAGKLTTLEVVLESE